jgi:hypothetical protein
MYLEYNRCAVVSVFWLWREIVLQQRRNRYLEVPAKRYSTKNTNQNTNHREFPPNPSKTEFLPNHQNWIPTKRYSTKKKTKIPTTECHCWQGCVFVLDRTDFLVVVFVVAPVFFGTRTKNMIRKSIPSSTKTEQLFCVGCVTLRKSIPSGTNTGHFFLRCVRNSSNLEIGLRGHVNTAPQEESGGGIDTHGSVDNSKVNNLTVPRIFATPTSSMMLSGKKKPRARGTNKRSLVETPPTPNNVPPPACWHSPWFESITISYTQQFVGPSLSSISSKSAQRPANKKI